MQINVWDDRYPCSLVAGRAEWQRWRDEAGEGPKSSAWSQTEPSHYTVKAGSEWSDLRYRNLVPTCLSGALCFRRKICRILRSLRWFPTFTHTTRRRLIEYRTVSFAPCWVGDLTLSAQVEAKSSQGTIRLELVEAGVPNRCEIDLETGEARAVSRR